MVDLIQQQRHFLYLVASTTAAQRKAILKTITSQQLKALSQIAYNIIRFKGRLTLPEKKKQLKTSETLHLLAWRS